MPTLSLSGKVPVSTRLNVSMKTVSFLMRLRLKTKTHTHFALKDIY